jgi:regulator of nonsense transcripts 2
MKLQSSTNRDKVDKLAEEFCYINTKNARKRVARELFRVPWDHIELIPYYARFAAILHQVFKDLATHLLKLLENEFFKIMKQKNQNRLESKLRNVRFIAELVKFKV